MKILLKDATIIDHSNPLHCESVSLLIENGIIKQIDKNISTQTDIVVSDNNLHVSRGWWDVSVSFGRAEQIFLFIFARGEFKWLSFTYV